MALTLEQMQTRLDALLDMRFRGVRETTVEGRRVSYATDSELAAAIRDLEKRIGRADGRKGRRVLRTHATKDL